MPNKVDDVIRAIVELGGTYPDVVQALQQAKSSHALASRFEVDALPDGDRAYRHKDEGPADGEPDEPDAADRSGQPAARAVLDQAARRKLDAASKRLARPVARVADR